MFAECIFATVYICLCVSLCLLSVSWCVFAECVCGVFAESVNVYM